MAFNAQLPSTFGFQKQELIGKPVTGWLQVSCYAFNEKVSAITNPISLRHDILYPNAAAAFRSSSSTQPHISCDEVLAEGCKGHQIDQDFCLESQTPFVMPLVMFPTKTSNGTLLHEVDLCAEPVLNWEGYMHELKKDRTLGNHLTDGWMKGVEVTEDASKQGPGDTEPNGFDSNGDIPSQNRKPLNSTSRSRRKEKSAVRNFPSLKKLLISDSNKATVEAEQCLRFCPIRKLPQDDTKVDIKDLEVPFSRMGPVTKLRTGGPMGYSTWLHLRNVPPVRVEGTWNHLYGGYNGACCYVNNNRTNNCCLFSGKGSQLRSIQLKKPTDPSIFSYSLKSIWEEAPRSTPFNIFAKDRGPLNDLIFQVVPNEHRDLLGVRRGKSIQIYSIDDEQPFLLETIPNIYYNTNEACPAMHQAKKIDLDPLLTGLCFNPKYSPEVITVDENGVVRICDISNEETISMYMLPKVHHHHGPRLPEGYPNLHLNQALGVSYSSLAHLILGWRDSVVSLCDRRESTNNCPVSTIMDLRNESCFVSLAEQNVFHDMDKPPKLNEYISCVKESRHDSYYYVGTSSNVYLMDLRVPNRPVFRMRHGLQSPLTYLDITSDENYDVIVGGSQRLSETFCMITDQTHTSCIDRPGCSNEGPILYCYPKHLSNPRYFFDLTSKEGFDFQFPLYHDIAKDHCYAWPTGLTVFPTAAANCDNRRPGGIIVATSNNFGDIFLQEWNQKPNPSKLEITDGKIQTFMKEWRNSMIPKLSKISSPTPSKSVYKPFDISLIIEPSANEIEVLPRVRSVPFNCFKPHKLQHIDNLKTMLPKNDLIYQLLRYKNERVKGIVGVWHKEAVQPSDTANQTEPVQVKIEREEREGSVPSSLQTINLDVSFSGELDEEQLLDVSFFENTQQFLATVPLPVITPLRTSMQPPTKLQSQANMHSPANLPSPARMQSPASIIQSSSSVNTHSTADITQSSSDVGLPEAVAEDQFFTGKFSPMKDENYSHDMFDFAHHFEEGPTPTVFHSQEELFPEVSQDLFSNFPSTSSQSQFTQSQSQKKIVKRRKSGFL